MKPICLLRTGPRTTQQTSVRALDQEAQDLGLQLGAASSLLCPSRTKLRDKNPTLRGPIVCFSWLRKLGWENEQQQREQSGLAQPHPSSPFWEDPEEPPAWPSRGQTLGKLLTTRRSCQHAGQSQVTIPVHLL